MKSFRRILKIQVVSLFIALGFSAGAQDTIIHLWPKNIPDQVKSGEKEVIKQGDIKRISNVQNPVIEVFMPSKRNANGRAMLIFPGGGYHFVAMDYAGTDIAKSLNAHGIAAIVVKYRLPDSKSLKTRHNVPLEDAQRAMRITRGHAKSWNFDENKIGIIGFSAGGHVASTLGTHFNDEVYEKQDDMDDLSARPDFMALLFSVISMQDGTTHQGSRRNLLGNDPNKALIDRFSNEMQVTKETPPTFLVHAEDDPAVPVENSLLFYKALKENGVPASMHLYPAGGHGFSLAIGKPYLGDWPRQLLLWLDSLEL